MTRDLRPGPGPADPGIVDVLLSHPAVAEAEIVSAAELSDRPVAAVVTRRRTNGWELRQFLRLQVDDEELPDLIAVMRNFPRDGDGATDLDALRGQLASLPGLYRFVPPRDELESWLVSLWETTIGQSGIGVADGFLELGGHSLSGLSALSEIKATHGVQISLSDLFAMKTIDRLAAAIRSARHDGRDR